nr:hypothetical protein [Tanacetum cinerariifolium]
NKHLEERLDSHGARLYTLKNLDIPQQRLARSRHERDSSPTNVGNNSYKTHEDHMMLYEALEKSMNCDHTEELLKDLAEEHKKKKKSRDSPNTPPGSPPHQPPSPPPPAGQSHGSVTPSSSKTAASAKYKAWITTDTRLRPSVSSTPEDLPMDDDMAPDAQVHSSDDEDIGNAHIPKTKHLVIRQRLEDFQLRIESYQTQLNLTKPQWDATAFEYKHDYTVIDSPRTVTIWDRYRVQMVMRFNEIHKFSDDTLHQIDEALDYQVREFKVNRMNSGLNIRFWTRKDVDRSKEFMFAIQKRLKTRRIFRNLESFVGGRVTDGDYRLLKRTK